MSRYAIVTEGITHKAVHAIEETDIRDVNQAIIEMKARQLSSSPVLLLDWDTRSAKRIVFDGPNKVTLEDNADEMFGINTPPNEMLEREDDAS